MIPSMEISNVVSFISYFYEYKKNLADYITV